MRSPLALSGTVACLLTLPLSNCVCEFGTPDAGKSDGGPTDRAGTDSVGQDTFGRDTFTPPTDSGPGRDNYVPQQDAARPDTWHPPFDANFNPDVVGIDTFGTAQLGDDCANLPCIAGTTCLGEPGNYRCRKNCTLNGTDCNAEFEHCTPWNYHDGGPAPFGGCLPAGGLGANCQGANCAELYVCVSPSTGPEVYLCRARCTPGTDGGCPTASPVCVRITNMDGGACLPN